MDRVSSTTGKIYWIWASLFLFWTSYLSDCLTVSLSLLQKWNWAERASFIFCPRLAMQHRPLPHVRTAAAPTGDMCLGRWRGDRWQRVSLHHPISFGSKTQLTSGPRLVTWAARHREWGVYSSRFHGRRGKLRHAQLFPFLPIRAHSFPSLPFDGVAPFGHMWSIGHAFGQNFLIRSFGRARCPYAGHYTVPTHIVLNYSFDSLLTGPPCQTHWSLLN